MFAWKTIIKDVQKLVSVLQRFTCTVVHGKIKELLGGTITRKQLLLVLRLISARLDTETVVQVRSTMGFGVYGIVPSSGLCDVDAHSEMLWEVPIQYT